MAAANQLALFVTPTPRRVPRSLPMRGRCGRFMGRATIQERFMRFHESNPQVYEKLVELARQSKARGFTTYGIEVLFALMRWHFDMERDAAEQFKLNDHYTSRYARLIMEREADLRGFFRTRNIHS